MLKDRNSIPEKRNSFAGLVHFLDQEMQRFDAHPSFIDRLWDMADEIPEDSSQRPDVHQWLWNEAGSMYPRTPQAPRWSDIVRATNDILLDLELYDSTSVHEVIKLSVDRLQVMHFRPIFLKIDTPALNWLTNASICATYLYLFEQILERLAERTNLKRYNICTPEQYFMRLLYHECASMRARKEHRAVDGHKFASMIMYSVVVFKKNFLGGFAFSDDIGDAYNKASEEFPGDPVTEKLVEIETKLNAQGKMLIVDAQLVKKVRASILRQRRKEKK